MIKTSHDDDLQYGNHDHQYLSLCIIIIILMVKKTLCLTMSDLWLAVSTCVFDLWQWLWWWWWWWWSWWSWWWWWWLLSLSWSLILLFRVVIVVSSWSSWGAWGRRSESLPVASSERAPGSGDSGSHGTCQIKGNRRQGATHLSTILVGGFNIWLVMVSIWIIYG